MRILLIGNGFDISHCSEFKFDIFFKYFVKYPFKCKFKKIEKFANDKLELMAPNIDELGEDKELWKTIFESAVYKLEKFDSFEDLFEYIEEETNELIEVKVKAKKMKIKKQKIKSFASEIVSFFKHVMLFYLFELDALEMEQYIMSKKYKNLWNERIRISFAKYDYCLTTNYTRYLDMVWDELKQNELQKDRNSSKVVHLHGAFGWNNIFDFLRNIEFEFSTKSIVWSDEELKCYSELNGLEYNLNFVEPKKGTTIKLDIFGFSVNKDNGVIVNLIEHLYKNIGKESEIRMRFFYYGISDLNGFNDFVTENEAFLRKKRVKVFKEPYQNFYGIYSDKIIKK
jgi:hypothetical protein